jgi:hypothetical protein
MLHGSLGKDENGGNRRRKRVDKILDNLKMVK